MSVLRVVVASASYRRAYAFGEDKAFVVVGRGLTCDVVLADAQIDDCHVFFEREGPQWSAVDRGSPSGTLMGGVPLRVREPRTVPTRCWMRLGSTTLEVLTRPPEVRRNRAASEHRYIALSQMRDETPLEVTCVEGAAWTVPLLPRRRPYRMGRTPFCELRLPDPRLPSEPVELSVSAEGAAVTNASDGPIRLGETSLAAGAQARWDCRDMMQVGPYVFALRDAIREALDDLEASTLADDTDV